MKYFGNDSLGDHRPWSLTVTYCTLIVCSPAERYFFRASTWDWTIVPVVPEALIAYPPEPDARMPQFGFGAELKPPGLISVAPNGMPVPLDPPEPSMPRGEVAPIADGLIELCAWLEPQLIATASIAAVITRNRRIADSVACFG